MMRIKNKRNNKIYCMIMRIKVAVAMTNLKKYQTQMKNRKKSLNNMEIRKQ